MQCGRFNRRLAIVACAAILAGGLRTRAYGFAGGTGEPNDPYQIATTEQLLSIGSNDALLDKHFVLLNDIDFDPNLLGGRVFDDALIAQDSEDSVSSHSGDPFSGVLDGRGHTIWNLSISGRYGYDAALFGKFSGLVQDLHFRNVRISGSPCGAIAGLSQGGMMLRCSVTGEISGSEQVGGMVGTLWTATLMDCQAEVRVTGDRFVGGMVGGGPGGMLVRCASRVDVAGDESVGGLVGELREARIVDSRATGTVTGRDNIGGLVGSMPMAVSILRSTSNCEVMAEQASGGLAGAAPYFGGHSQWIIDSYAHGSVTGSVAGGLIGVASALRVVDSYAACTMIPMMSETEPAAAVLGGLFGEVDTSRPPLVIASFWDTEVSGVPLSSGTGTQHFGMGLDTAQMQQVVTFEQAGWDFDATWTIPDHDYLVLQWELAGAVDEGPLGAGRQSAEAADSRYADDR